MKQGLYIDRNPFETRVALIEREQTAEIHVEFAGEPSPAGAIWRARVTDLMGQLQAAAVDLGADGSGFLRAGDARVLLPDGAGGKEKRLPIGKMMRRGDTVLVQAVRGGTDGKQIRVTADISLPGRYLTLYPLRQGIDIPKRIGEPEQRSDLKDLAHDILTATGLDCRVVFRAAAPRVDRDLVAAELERLLQEWQAIADRRDAPPARLLNAPDMLERALVEIAPPSPEGIAVPDRGLAADLRARAARLAPDLVNRIVLAPADQGTVLDQELEAALLPEVAIGGGGRITIETTRALTAIDVDSGNSHASPVDINMRAVQTIAAQLRLRQLSGPVVIDFISMRAGNERKRVEAALRRAFERDPAQVDVAQVDRFSLATMIRSHGAGSLASRFLKDREPDLVLNDAAAAAQLLRRLTAELGGVGAQPVRLVLPKVLEGSFRAVGVAALEQGLGRPVTMDFEALDPDQYRLERQK